MSPHCYQVAPLAQKKSYWSILHVTNKILTNHIPIFFYLWVKLIPWGYETSDDFPKGNTGYCISIGGVQFLFYSDPSHQVFRRQRNALWDAGWRRSQDGSERQAEDRAWGGKALNEVSDWTSIVAACSQVWRRAVEVVYGLSTFTNSSRITKQLRIKSRMNSDEKEDCECAPPQAETSAAGGTYR